MIRFATRTHPGRVHEDNEDAIGVDEARRIWLIADGMGGHASGEVASAIVRDTILQSPGPSLTEAVKAAHRAVVAAATSNDHYKGMGSTVVAVSLHDDEAEIVWVGDSRSYLWRAGALRRMSRDHSVVELLRDAGELSEAQIQTHPQRHVVTQTLGHGDPVPSTAHFELRGGDWVILCSDGLHDELDDAEISELLANSPTIDDAVSRLVDAGLAKGGRDNISVVAVAVSYDDLPARRRRLSGIAIPPAVLGVVAALLLGIVLLLLLRVI
jgi:PPM family protein phosphatase